MFKTVLIANRGEIAVRIARTCKRLGVRSVVVYSDADRDSLHVAAADVAIALGGPEQNASSESYLRGDRILEIARETGAEAVIPGYGFLSENTEFAAQCAAAGIVFVGPTPDQIRRFGLKHISRELAAAAGVPLTPGSGLLASLEAAKTAALEIGYPLMLKSTAGGGGIGLSRCDDEGELAAAFDSVRHLGHSFFNDGGVFVERFVADARHLEVQIFGDGRGKVVALGERDCSVQRRNQKVVEETPAPHLPAATRKALFEAAVKLGESVGYASAGTVEFIYDGARDAFYFLEVNTRLQVEHPVTEAVTGLDLVEWMLRTAAGEPPSFEGLHEPEGAAIEARIYAENPVRNFQPSPGVLTDVRFPEGVRVDTWVQTGTEVSARYDPMIAKVIAHGATREEARGKLLMALELTELHGISTNLDYLRSILASAEFAAGSVSTRFLDRYEYVSPVVEVIEPGTYTTVQDYPGRHGHWDVGVPPSGPMDDYAFRMANRIVGNHASAAGLECTLQGPTLRFHGPAVIALTGAPAHASLDDGDPLPWWKPIAVRANQVLRIGRATAGCRSYVAIRRGIDVPDYLGAKATFVLGQFGGHAGRTLRIGDLLPVSRPELASCNTPAPPHVAATPPRELVPAYGKHWRIGVLYGPHGAPDFFTEAAIATFFATDYVVHYNSNRLGVRLVGPKPEWTRSDGGEAGLHPSNIHDCVYAIGSINFTGDTPVILTCDGPSLGGFVCPATIAKAELWKVGQVKPGDTIRFERIDFARALALELAQDGAIEMLRPPAAEPANEPDAIGAGSECVLAALPAEGARPEVVYRQAGDKYLLLEYGPNELDLRLRLRIHLLMEALKAACLPGIGELSPGVRSVQIHYDSRVIAQRALIDELIALEVTLSDVGGMTVPSRIVHLPMAFEDSATLGAVGRYRETVKAEAPWLPNNVDFIRRINGLASRDDVRRTVFDASYMVLGLGDVYLGAPCAVPLDPRHRLLTSKYNPARTFTAEGTVGIGGVYMCIYGMDSPGGYQLVGRTLPIWNKFLQNEQFAEGEPWLLRFFDRVRFHPVSEAELDRLRVDFRAGRARIDIEDSRFDLAEHEREMTAAAGEIEAFKARQHDAFAAEVARWRNEGGADAEADDAPAQTAAVRGEPVRTDISGNVWKVLVEVGQHVEAGQPLVLLEAMKMEFPIVAAKAGTVRALHCRSGKLVSAGDTLLVTEAH